MYLLKFISKEEANSGSLAELLVVSYTSYAVSTLPAIDNYISTYIINKQSRVVLTDLTNGKDIVVDGGKLYSLIRDKSIRNIETVYNGTFMCFMYSYLDYMLETAIKYESTCRVGIMNFSEAITMIPAYIGLDNYLLSNAYSDDKLQTVLMRKLDKDEKGYKFTADFKIYPMGLALRTALLNNNKVICKSDRFSLIFIEHRVYFQVVNRFLLTKVLLCL